LRQVLFEAAMETGARVHNGGTYLAMEGPQLSTRAESQLYRAWGADIIGMTALPEAKLAREAEICYATLAFVTDYDCWHPEYESVTVDMILTNLRKGVDTGKKLLRLVMPHIPKERDCACGTALERAIATGKKYIPDQAKENLGLLIGKYLNR
jgi:5'-methylthioadenosine phosphorylase